VAGDRLRRGGHEVVVLEARDRVGGRILTVRDGLADNQYADAGAEIVYGGQPLIPDLCARLSLPLTDSFPLGNTRRRMLFNDLLLSEEEGETAARTLASAFADSPAAPYEPLSAWLRRVRLPAHAASLARAIAQSSPGGRPSFADPLEVQKNLSHASGFRKILGGSDLLPKAIARTLDIRLSFPVRRIAWSRNGVAVGGATTTVNGDRCIVAVPGPVTSEIGFDPPLPARWAQAQLALQYGNASRIIVQYADAAALRPRLAAGIFTDGMPSSLHDQSMHLPGSAMVLSGIAGGDDEPSLQSEAEVLDGVDGIVQRVVGRPVKRLFGKVIAWTRDPWSRAVVRAPLADQRTALIPFLAEPIGNRLFFAGEHTDGREGPGGMEGAARSGLRAAEEIVQSER
jgi:monoamine oxidase